MIFLRLLGRGVRDVFDQLFALIVFSVGWWLCQLTIVLGPPATVALFAMADPRRQVASPELRDVLPVLKSSFRRGWGIFLCTIPLIVVLIWNVTFFSDSNHALRVMIPLWLIMSVILIIVALFAFGTAGTLESGVRNAYRGAMYILIVNPFRSIGLALLLIALTLLMTVTVIPMLFLGPGLIAAVVNRFVLAGLQVHVIDPNSPTDERATEQERGINPEKGFLQRLKGAPRR